MRIKKQNNKIQSLPAFFKGPKILEPKTISCPDKPITKYFGVRKFPRRHAETPMKKEEKRKYEQTYIENISNLYNIAPGGGCSAGTGVRLGPVPERQLQLRNN
ncbi:hypothetical protein MSBRW_2749 [Methanosarcina barkeri str. Wiesmoor]|uniref:Uncharacterized protein n=1 Tax=Methanosarcina barkeri str. Wiesmoor TaxID=1434109 RepID=A0A0E3QLV6_METBA|nr:hypothetical protein [Methanosarcina barkeri]AKB52002.1 hypothetical protein MSBRW_2749 [Methanosarcina barkeri str. Wiesmoor]